MAIDQAYQRRQKDSEGDFYRKIARKSPRGDGSNGGTTQGLYVSAPDGTYLGYSNHRDPRRIEKMLDQALEKYRPGKTAKVESVKVDRRYNPEPPKNGLVLRVHAKILGGYPETEDRWKSIFQSAISRDNLWISEKEHRDLVKGNVPESVKIRIARFHLVDGTRGEPPMWRPNEIKDIKMEIEGERITGSAKFATADGSRGFDARILGKLKIENNKISELTFLAKGDFWGEGPYTRNAPKGKFPLAVTFRLADGKDVADAIPPQGSRGWIQGYMRPGQ